MSSEADPRAELRCNWSILDPFVEQKALSGLSRSDTNKSSEAGHAPSCAARGASVHLSEAVLFSGAERSDRNQ
jgi:hypothetical protein